MIKNKVTLVREGNKFLIKEPGFDNELVSFEAYYLEISGKYLLCFECTFKDYFRTGSREKDISNVVFDIVDNLREAKVKLYEKAKIESINLAQDIRYEFEDLINRDNLK
ncbi:MAG: hypothetical protein AABW75_01030 [Nanoarchaeota archaeon]